MKIPKHIKKKIISLPGVVSVGVCKKNNQDTVLIEVLSKHSPSLPKEIEGMKVEVQTVSDLPELDIYHRKYRPIIPGIYIMRGSIGGFVRFNGKIYLLTAAHLVSTGWRKGSKWYQPTAGFDYPTYIGKLDRWIDIYRDTADKGEPSEGDLMAIEVDPSVGVSNELSIDMPGFTPQSITEPELGESIISVGATTGLKTAKVVEVDMLQYFRGVGDNPNWWCDNIFKYDTQTKPGDSGGGIFSSSNTSFIGTHVGSIQGTGYAFGGSVSQGLKALELDGAQIITRPIMVTTISFWVDNPKVVVNNKEKYVDNDNPDVAPFMVDEWWRVFIPLRFLAENLGFHVDWDGKEQRVEITKADRYIVLWVDRNYAFINGEKVLIDKDNDKVTPLLVDKWWRVFLPVRFIAEALGASVSWDGGEQKVDIVLRE